MVFTYAVAKPPLIWRTSSALRGAAAIWASLALSLAKISLSDVASGPSSTRRVLRLVVKSKDCIWEDVQLRLWTISETSKGNFLDSANAIIGSQVAES